MLASNTQGIIIFVKLKYALVHGCMRKDSKRFSKCIYKERYGYITYIHSCNQTFILNNRED
jgi:hypothetical protein